MSTFFLFCLERLRTLLISVPGGEVAWNGNQQLSFNTFLILRRFYSDLRISCSIFIR
jgi:hypothetical protein